MSSVVDPVPRLRANAASDGRLPENGYSSSSIARHPSQTPPTSPVKVTYRPTGCRPQISIDQADSDVTASTTMELDSNSIMQAFHSGSTADTDQTNRSSPFPDRNYQEISFAHENGNDSHLQVQPRAKKSNTLPTNLTGIDYSEGVQSGQSSLYNSSEAEYDSDESSARDPRDLLQNEKYWQDKRTGMIPLLAHCYRKDSVEISVPVKVRRKGKTEDLDGAVDGDKEVVEEGYDEEEYMSNSEGSGDEDSGSTAPSFPRDSKDDEVFRSDFCGGRDVFCDADSKLVDWSYNVFVPASRTLLHHCREGGATELSSAQILTDLRSLTNTISFFCSEQQRLSSGQLRGGVAAGGGNNFVIHRRQGISASISTDRISRIRDLAKTQDKPRTDDGSGDVTIKTASMSSDSASSSGFESQDGSYDRSYSVKILRSVSQSLIAPLVQEAEDGFTPELYKSIVQAIQKIAWKVEACLAINDPSKETDVYLKIFDLEQQESLAEMMINALPPEEPKLVTAAPGRSSRSGSMTLVMRRTTSSGRASLGLEIDQTSEGSSASKMPSSSAQIRYVPGRGRIGVPISADSLDLTVSGSSDATCVSSFLDSVSTTASGDNRRSGFSAAAAADFVGELTRAVDMPAIRRDRVATFASPSRNSKAWYSFDEQERDANCRLSSDQLDSINEPHYFRPKHVRRTTVSLSRKEVSKLGWKVARRVEKSTSALTGTSGGDGGGKSMTGVCVDDVGDIKLTTRTKRMHKNGVNSLSGLHPERRVDASNLRTKSASMSDLLENLPSASERTGIDITAGFSFKRRKSRNRSYDLQGADADLSVTLKHQSSTDSTSLGDHLAKSYLPISKQTSLPEGSSNIEEEWTFVTPDPAASLGSSKRLRSGSRNSKILIGGAAKTLSRKAKKLVVQKSLSASEKFTSKVIKTANALRRGSISTFSKAKKDGVSVVSAATSMDELQEEVSVASPFGGRPPRPSSASEPPSLLGPKKSGTMPQKRSTLSRLSHKAKKAGSFGSSTSLPRKSKKEKAGQQKAGFATTQVAPADQAALTESIYHFSKNAVQPSMEETEDQLLISVEMASKDASRQYRKRSSIISSSNSSSYLWYEITITTNMKKFGRQHYTIVRNLKQVNALYDSAAEACVGSDSRLPERPEKRMANKMQREKVEAFLLCLVTMPSLQSSQLVVDFLKPDEGFGTAAGNSETKLDLLMTFYTPDVYPGPPGSHHDIHLVNPEDVPDSSSPSRPRRHGGTLQKKGTFHMVRNQEASSTFVIQEEGQDALIVSCAEDRYTVVAGTFEKLVEQLACEENPDATFVMTFLLGYRHFTTPMELLSQLLRRFRMTVAPNPTEEEVAYAEKWRYVIQLRVLDVVMYWLRKCWPDFYRIPDMLDSMREFTEELKVSKDTNFQLAGTTLDKMLADKLSMSSAQYRISTVSEDTADSTSSSLPNTPSHFQTASPASPGPTYSSPGPSNNSPGPSQEADSSGLELKPRSPKASTHVNIHTLPAIQLARQLTLVESDYLKAIDIHELVVYFWEPNSAANKPYRRHIDEYIGRFNKLSYWVSSEVCSTQDPHSRGALIEKFVEVAKYCQDCKNFNSTIAIVSGLSLVAVRRLKKSWEFVSDKSVKTFHKMCQIMSPTNNHNSYRKTFSNTTRKDCIPYFGVFMRDITFFNDGNHKKLKNGLLNFSKLRSMVCKFEELKLYQRSKFLFTPDEKLQDYCRNLWCLTEQDLYEASEKLEPREVALPITTPTSVADTSQQFDETDV